MTDILFNLLAGSVVIWLAIFLIGPVVALVAAIIGVLRGSARRPLADDAVDAMRYSAMWPDLSDDVIDAESWDVTERKRLTSPK